MLRITDFSLKRLSILVLIISSTIFLSRLYEPSLSDDSVKYALIGKTMLKEGNFLFPHLGEEPYYKKPPLFFWLIAASFKVFGFNNSALFGVLSPFFLFYFDNWSKKAKFLISNECGGKALLKFGNYCVKESYAGSSGNYSQRLERRN
ncbi:hypothetical protein C7457_0360 [Thermovibrio guaymasensis]|uniref:Dolichyl-phosphate-mannose-protein mannosyltransferase n=1 Tax=Thermovibrio guaymasensis TaxID=240167 RepID=A0A420W846_9BACT|nr:hypothetical protein [Thermovibrio guaymasensis]RKQ63487.1 hypothetical protein C7457_0360 [Thermovibrio guaymasensis]